MRWLVHSQDRDALAVALIDDEGLLWEYHEEDRDTIRTLGNVYLGRVVNVEAAIQSAFIDIGERRTAFLHISDLHPAYEGASRVPVDQLGERPPRERGEDRIQDILRRGQEVLVQVSKESIGQKGPTVTTLVGLPGRSVVLMTGLDRPGISRKIIDEKERDRLRILADQLPGIPNAGIIVRTAARVLDLDQLTAEVEVLAENWKRICASAQAGGGPVLLHREADLLLRTARDLVSEQVQEVVFDDPWAAENFLEYRSLWNPGEVAPVRLHRSKSPLFMEFGSSQCVEQQINSIYDRKVALASGGSLVIDETEALVAIDVNSGSSTSESDLESTALRTNLEAAREIARNLRLRDIGGVVVCDFIDMMEIENRRTVEDEFRGLVRDDRAKIWFAKISRFGLLELTRQRIGPSKDRAGREPCPACLGRGTVRSASSVAIGVIRELRQGIAKSASDEALVTVGQPVRDLLLGARREDLDALELEFGKRIVVLGGQDWSPERWTIQYR